MALFSGTAATCVLSTYAYAGKRNLKVRHPLSPAQPTGRRISRHLCTAQKHRTSRQSRSGAACWCGVSRGGCSPCREDSEETGGVTAHDFAVQSLVCYTFCGRWLRKGAAIRDCRRIGDRVTTWQAVSADSRTEHICNDVRIANVLCSYVGNAVKLRVVRVIERRCRKQKVYITRRCARCLPHHRDCKLRNSFRIFRRADFSVILARLSLSRKCFAVSVSGCSLPSSKP